MQNNQAIEQTFNILCDKIFYQRLKSVEQNQWMKIFMFPVKNSSTKSLSFVIFDIIKSKPSSQLKEFKQDEFYSTCKSICQGISPPQVLSYLFSKQSIQQLLGDGSKKIKISCPQQTKQLNQLIKQCVVLSLNLPNGFYENSDCNYNLQGYKFNAIGKIKQTWSYINNGRVTKALLAKQNDKIQHQLQQNKTYSKNQLTKILQKIQNVNNLTSNQNQQNKSKVVQELRVLGQNYCHSEKFSTNSNGLVPILNFEVELLCSMTRGQSCKNKVAKQPVKALSKVSHNLCLNLSEGIQICENIIKKKWRKSSLETKIF